MEKITLILDKEEYKKKEDEIAKIFQENNYDVKIVHTKYEDFFIRKVRNVKYIGSMIQHLLYWMKSFLYALKVILLSRNKKIIAINPIVGMFLGALNITKNKEIVLCGFLFENKKSQTYYKLRKKITKIFLRGISKIVVYSSKEIAYYKKIFPEIDKFTFVKYGIDYNANRKYTGQLPKEYIFSGGGSNRDYKTLIEAYNQMAIKLPLYIATKISCVENIDITKINLLTDVVLETFGDVMGRAKIVVLSLKDEEISAGHQVLLQALKENAVIIVNRISSIEDYVDEENVIFYKSKQQQDLISKIEYVIENYEEQRNKYSDNEKYYKENYTFNCFINRLIKLI